MLKVKCERCAGIDVGKKFLLVCVMIGLANQKPAVEVRRFSTNVKELERLRDMAAGDRMYGSGDGEHGFLLETGVQHFGRKTEDHFGESRAGEGIAGKENGSEG